MSLICSLACRSEVIVLSGALGSGYGGNPFVIAEDVLSREWAAETS